MGFGCPGEANCAAVGLKALVAPASVEGVQILERS